MPPSLKIAGAVYFIEAMVIQDVGRVWIGMDEMLVVVGESSDDEKKLIPRDCSSVRYTSSKTPTIRGNEYCSVTSARAAIPSASAWAGAAINWQMRSASAAGSPGATRRARSSVVQFHPHRSWSGRSRQAPDLHGA